MFIFGCSLIMPDLTCNVLDTVMTALKRLPGVDYPKLNTELLTELTPRQCEIVEYIIRGRTAKQIGRFLSISYKTVEHQTAIIKDKLNCQYKSDIIDRVCPTLGESLQRSQTPPSPLANDTHFLENLVQSTLLIERNLVCPQTKLTRPTTSPKSRF